jgi:hypothetical protein
MEKILLPKILEHFDGTLRRSVPKFLAVFEKKVATPT